MTFTTILFVIQPKAVHKTSTKLDLIYMKSKSRLLLSTERKQSLQTETDEVLNNSCS